MSKENVELVRRSIKAFSDGGIDAALEYFDPAIEWWAPPEWLEDRLYRGHEGVRKLTAFWTQQFDEFQLEPERFIDLGDDQVLALLHQRGRIKGSSDRIEQPFGYSAHIREGKLTQVHVYFSWEAALKAAGVRE
jgi:ketosteroid isomerase-like protein